MSTFTKLVISTLLLMAISASALSFDSVSEPLRPRGTGDLCAAAGVSAAVVDGRLYFGGGQYAFVGGDFLVNEQQLFYIDLQKPFPSGGYLLKSNFTEIALPKGLDSSDGSLSLFNDNTTLYFYESDVSSSQMWTYDVSTDSFNNVTVGGTKNVPTTGFVGAYVSNPVTGLSYYIGSSTTAIKKRAVTTPTLQVLDSSTPDIQWQAVEGNEAPPLRSSQMNYVRAGAEGILVAFGGVDPDAHGEFAETSLGNYYTLDTIFIFDIESNTWFTVTATGDIPEQRLQFCSGVSSAPDDTSFQIIIYGGYDLLDGSATNTMYVLTLPAFQWIDVTTEQNNAFGRHQHACAIWNDAQMISIGGTLSSVDDSGPTVESCSASAPALLVLDTTTFLFKDEFDPTQVYTVPEAVSDLIGGNSSGLSKVKAPPGGFNDSRLDTIFAQTVARVIEPASLTSSTPTSSATGTPNSTSITSGSSSPTNSDVTLSSSVSTPPSSSHSSKHIGPAIGGALAGAACVIVVFGLIWLYRRRARAQRLSSAPASDSNSTGRPELNGESPAMARYYHEVHGNPAYAEMPNDAIRSELPSDAGRSELPSDAGHSELP